MQEEDSVELAAFCRMRLSGCALSLFLCDDRIHAATIPAVGLVSVRRRVACIFVLLTFMPGGEGTVYSGETDSGLARTGRCGFFVLPTV